MKYVVKECPGLKRRLELEGHQVVDSGKVDATWTPGEVWPTVAVQSLGYEISRFDTDFFVSRYFDNGAWSDQLWLGIPVVGLMDGGRSAREITACAGCYVRSEKFKAHLERPELLLALTGQKCFVTLWFSSEDGKIGGLETGLPRCSVFNVLEGVATTVGEFLVDPLREPLKESWTVSILVSRFPFPSQQKTSENCFIGGVTNEVEKHLWLGEHTRFKAAVYTTSTVVGTVTAWSSTLVEASRRALGTCRNLSVDQVQYRTDVGAVTGAVWERVKQWL